MTTAEISKDLPTFDLCPRQPITTSVPLCIGAGLTSVSQAGVGVTVGGGGGAHLHPLPSVPAPAKLSHDSVPFLTSPVIVSSTPRLASPLMLLPGDLRTPPSVPAPP